MEGRTCLLHSSARILEPDKSYVFSPVDFPTASLGSEETSESPLSPPHTDPGPCVLLEAERVKTIWRPDQPAGERGAGFRSARGRRLTCSGLSGIWRDYSSLFRSPQLDDSAPLRPVSREYFPTKQPPFCTCSGARSGRIRKITAVNHPLNFRGKRQWMKATSPSLYKSDLQ